MPGYKYVFNWCCDCNVLETWQKQLQILPGGIYFKTAFEGISTDKVPKNIGSITTKQNNNKKQKQTKNR